MTTKDHYDHIKDVIRAEVEKCNKTQSKHRNMFCLRDIITDRDFVKFVRESLYVISLYGELQVHDDPNDKTAIWIELKPSQE